MEDCIFCKIIRNDLPSYKVDEDEMCLAVMDKYPVASGQVLVIARKHQESGFSRMDESTAISLLKIAKKLANRMVEGLSCREVTFKIEGLEVVHAHAKIYPVYSTEEYVRQIADGPHVESDDILKVNSEKIRKGE